MRACTIEGCGRPLNGHGLCRSHAMRLQRYGTACPEVPIGAKHGQLMKHLGRMPARQRKVRRICDIEGCSNTVHCRGLCNAHRQRAVRYGDPVPSVPLGSSPYEVAAAAGMEPDVPDACVDCGGPIDTGGRRCARCMVADIRERRAQGVR